MSDLSDLDEINLDPDRSPRSCAHLRKGDVPPFVKPEWTAPDIAKLRRMWINGLKDDEIALRMPGRTARAIQQKRYDIGLYPTALKNKGADWSENDDAILAYMYVERRKSLYEIAGELKRTFKGVENRRHYLGLSRNRSKARPLCRRCSMRPIAYGSSYCRSCYDENRAECEPVSSDRLFSMVSKEEILPDGTRRRLYGDLRGL